MDAARMVKSAPIGSTIPDSAPYKKALDFFSPSEAIIDLCDELECDLIFMASHGRKGLAAVLLGSETQKVLTHSKVPVMVFR